MGELCVGLIEFNWQLWIGHTVKTSGSKFSQCGPHAWSAIGGFILSLVSIPQAYLRRTSDVNGSNFSVSRLLCSLGNACSSKPPKYTFKSRSTRLTSLLTLYQNKIRKLKHQSNCNEICRLHLAGNWRHAQLTCLLTAEVYELSRGRIRTQMFLGWLGNVLSKENLALDLPVSF